MPVHPTRLHEVLCGSLEAVFQSVSPTGRACPGLLPRLPRPADGRYEHAPRAERAARSSDPPLDLLSAVGAARAARILGSLRGFVKSPALTSTTPWEGPRQTYQLPSTSPSSACAMKQRPALGGAPCTASVSVAAARAALHACDVFFYGTARELGAEPRRAGARSDRCARRISVERLAGSTTRNASIGRAAASIRRRHAHSRRSNPG